MRLAFASVISALAALATAYTQPNYNNPPEGNAILKPGLNEQVPAGKPYTITWTPTTSGPISLVLLRGPSTNVKPIGTIAEAIPNNGHFVWTPSTSLEPDVTHYGILLVVQGTGQYQYSTQFGISNPNPGNGGSQTTDKASTTTATVISATTQGSSGGATSVTMVTTETTTECPETKTTASPTTIPVSVPTTTPAAPSSSAAPTTMQTSTVVAPTSAVPSVPSVPSNPPAPANPSTTAPAVPSAAFTGAASRNALSMGAVAAGAFAILAF